MSRLQLDDEYAASPSRDRFAVLLVTLQSRPWVVYNTPPPMNNASPEKVLKYLARYMTGGPISDRRLIEVTGGRVYFGARSSDKSGRQVPVSLPTIEFIRRWTLHILPKGFTKARRYGGWSDTRREAYQQQCERLQPIPPSSTEADIPDIVARPSATFSPRKVAMSHLFPLECDEARRTGDASA